MMDVDARIDLVRRNVVEVLTDEELQELLLTKRKPVAYHGTAPTGPYHIGYLIPIAKLFDFMRAGIKCKVLIADIHAALDDLKTPWEKIAERSEYYRKCIELAFPWEEKPVFVLGSSFQLRSSYVLDVLKISTLATVKRAMRAASEVTRMKNPKVSELIYPIMQAMDEVGLEADIQLGGIDQRHIFAFAREFLPKIGHKARVEIMTPLITSLKGPGTKMSASLPGTHIKIYDSEEQIRKKLREAFCPEGAIEGNPVLQICKYIVFTFRKKIRVERPEKFGGDIEFNNYEELEMAFSLKQLHPFDLKMAVANELIKLFSRARKYFEKRIDWLKELGDEFLP